MASDSSCGFFSHFRLGILHISLRPHKILPRGWKEENKRTNTDLGQLQAQESEFVTLCIPRASVDYRGRVFCAKLLQNPQGMLTHLWLFSLTASCWLSFPWTAISRRPSSSALRCRLPLSVLLSSTAPLSSLRPSFSRPLSVLREISPLGPLCGFHAKADKETLWLAHPPTQHNKWPHSVREVSICFIKFIEVELMNSKNKKTKGNRPPLLSVVDCLSPSSFHQLPLFLLWNLPFLIHFRSCGRSRR